MPIIDTPQNLLATISDLGELANPTPDDEDALLALQVATGIIQAYTRQDLVVVEDDEVTLDPENRHGLLLPQLPVNDVTEVTVDGDALTVADDVFWYSDGRLYRKDGARWGSTRQSIVVTYDHGYDPIPDYIRGICLAVAARLLSNPESLRQESIASYSRTFGSSSATQLTDDEARILDAARVRGLA